MKAAVFHGVGKPLAIETLDDPRPGPGDVVIKVHRCGICGTDLHMTADPWWGIPDGMVLGHEYVGEIVEIGPQVETYKKGDRITALPSRGCGHCDACAMGNLTLCSNAQGVMGGFGEYISVPSGNALKLPSTFSLADGALVEPFAVGRYGVRQASIAPGDRVLILGGGVVALTTIFWAKHWGAGPVVVISRSKRREKMALAMGADAFIQASEQDIENAAEALGGPPDIVYECVGAPDFLSRSINHVRQFGQVVSMGFCTAPAPMSPAVAAFKAVRLYFPVGYTLDDFQHAADVMLAGGIDPKMMITSVAPLDNLPDILEKLRGPNTETKVHIRPAGA